MRGMTGYAITRAVVTLQGKKKKEVEGNFGNCLIDEFASGAHGSLVTGNSPHL